MTLEDLWIGLVPTLSPRFRGIALDRPGHGESLRRGRTDAGLWLQTELIREAVRVLGLERPIILGHSFGGAVALAYGLAYPDEIAGVVALAPICFPEPRLETLLFGPRGVPIGGEWLSSAQAATSDNLLLPPALERHVPTANHAGPNGCGLPI